MEYIQEKDERMPPANTESKWGLSLFSAFLCVILIAIIVSSAMSIWRYFLIGKAISEGDKASALVLSAEQLGMNRRY